MILLHQRQKEVSIVLGRIVKFFQSFSILSSTYIVIVMAIDRCIAIVTPLKAGKIRVSSFQNKFDIQFRLL